MSLGVTPCAGAPSNETRIVFGRSRRSVPVAIACSASLEPMPQASAPNAPCVQVWLSGATSVQPGSTMPSSGEITWTMPCSRSLTSMSVIPAARAAARVSVMKALPPSIGVSSPRPGRVSTIWSITAKTRAGSRMERPAAASPLSATAPVRSCRNTRSMAISSAPDGVAATRCASHILVKSVFTRPRTPARRRTSPPRRARPPPSSRRRSRASPWSRTVPGSRCASREYRRGSSARCGSGSGRRR